MEKIYYPPHDSRIVEGLLRGAFLGACWGVFMPNPYHALDMISSTYKPKAIESFISNSEQSFKTNLKDLAKYRLKNMGRSSIVVSAFLGTYTSTTCMAERAMRLPPHHPASVFIGATVSGLLLSIAARITTPRTIIFSSIGTGLFASVIQVYSKF